jgi:hypothetical protein
MLLIALFNLNDSNHWLAICFEEIINDNVNTVIDDGDTLGLDGFGSILYL